MTKNKPVFFFSAVGIALLGSFYSSADTVNAYSDRELRDLGRNSRLHLAEAIEVGAAGQLQDIYNLVMQYENTDLQPAATHTIQGKSFFWEKLAFHPPESTGVEIELPQEYPVEIAAEMSLYYNTEGSARTLRRLLKLMRKEDAFPSMLNFADTKGRTLLFKAVENCNAIGRLKTIMVLLEAAADQSKKDKAGRTVADLLRGKATDHCVDQAAVKQLFQQKDPLGSKLIEFNAQLMNALDSAEEDQFAIARTSRVSAK